LHELLCLSKEIREALREALAESESFLTQLPLVPAEDEESEAFCSHCHAVIQQVPSITFMDEDMLLKDNNHDRPLYHNGYIGSSRIERI